MYNLQKLISQTVDVELVAPDGSKTGVIFTLRASHDPRIQMRVAEILATMPPAPTETNIGDIVKYNAANQLATRQLMIERVVKTNHQDLSTPDQISEFLLVVDYNTIEQLMEDSADRTAYFR